MVKKIKCGRCGSIKISINIDTLVTTYRCLNCGNISNVDVDKELEMMYKKDKKKFLNGK